MVLSAQVQVILESLNPWWRDSSAPVGGVKPYRRHAFASVHERVQRLGEPKWRAVLLEGLRQVGKTTLARQVIAQAQEDGLPGAQLAFVPVEDPRLAGSLTVDALLDSWRPYLDRARPAILILDEVHRLRDPSDRGEAGWARQVKSLVDRVDAGEFRIRVLATGSAAGELREAAGSAVGRLDTIQVDALTFGEFRELRAFPEAPPQETVFRDLDTYLATGGFPEHALHADYGVAEVLERIRKDTASALAEDLRDVRSIDDVRRLFSVLMDLSGEELNETNLAKSLRVQKDTIRRWLARMEEVHLIQRVPRWATNLLREIRGQPKVYGVASGIVAAYGSVRDPLGSEKLVGRLVEAAVLAHLRVWARSTGAVIRCYQKKARDSGGSLGEGDFFVQGPNESYLIEATSGTSNLSKKTAFLTDEVNSLRGRSKYRHVLAMVVYRGATTYAGPVPCVPLHEFLQHLSREPEPEGLRELHERSRSPA